MSRWFRFYDDAINDPKLLRLSDEHYRAWSILLCVASKNGGTLPPTEDIALALRLKPAKVALWITVLVQGGLIDNVDGVFSPHNWNTRQYASDGSAERMRRHRAKKVDRHGDATSDESCDVTVTAQNRTEQTQSRAEAEQTRAAVSNSEKVLRTDLMEAFGPSRCPDLARTSDWLAKGYAPGMIVDVVREMLARKPDIVSLAYFDSALAERYAKRPPTPAERAAGMTGEALEQAVRHFAKTGHWSRHAGPEPGLTGCRASAELLAKHGLGDDGQKLREAV